MNSGWMVVEWIPSLWKNSLTFSATWKIMLEDASLAVSVSLTSHLHVLCEVETPNVSGSDNSVSSQLPYVELVNGQDAVNLRHQLLLQRINLDMCGHSLQEDQGGLYQERPDRLEDENDEEDG